jgi:uncharacterized protein
MDKIILKGHKGIGGTGEGEALVCQEPINLMADAGNCWTNPKDATFTNKLGTPSVYGKSFKDKVLVFPTGKGGIFSTNIMMDMSSVGTRPKAIVNVQTHPVWAVLARYLNIPLVDRLDQNPCQVIENGDWVKVDGEAGIIEITKKS